jgi:hypothetical protein
MTRSSWLKPRSYEVFNVICTTCRRRGKRWGYNKEAGLICAHGGLLGALEEAHKHLARTEQQGEAHLLEVQVVRVEQIPDKTRVYLTDFMEARADEIARLKAEKAAADSRWAKQEAAMIAGLEAMLRRVTGSVLGSRKGERPAGD